jgi:hypothetical protein
VAQEALEALQLEKRLSLLCTEQQTGTLRAKEALVTGHCDESRAELLKINIQNTCRL